jgi:hypothetical protein
VVNILGERLQALETDREVWVAKDEISQRTERVDSSAEEIVPKGRQAMIRSAVALSRACSVDNFFQQSLPVGIPAW